MNITGSACFIMHRGRLRLTLRDDRPDISNPCRHALTGGGREGKEKMLHSIRREVFEETGVWFSCKRFIFLGKEKIKGKAFNYFYVLVITDAENMQMKILEGQSAGFYPLATVQLLGSYGDVRYGLGGAIYRFMLYEPHIIESVFANIYERFSIVR